VGPGRNDNPAPVDVAGRTECPVLGLFGGADSGIPPEAIAAYDAALTRAGIEHRLATYDGAPHSFFDRKAHDYAEASAAAWDEVLAFVRRFTAEG
jgi:carboxymethylenebutenolidase